MLDDDTHRGVASFTHIRNLLTCVISQIFQICFFTDGKQEKSLLLHRWECLRPCEPVAYLPKFPSYALAGSLIYSEYHKKMKLL